MVLYTIQNTINGLYFCYFYASTGVIFVNSFPLGLSFIFIAFIIARMASDMPDLSHLTAEERQIIESVMMRQKQEEEREHEIMR